MIVCSCNVITTDDIKGAIDYVDEFNERKVLNMLNWNPECSQCTRVLVEEIRRVFKEVSGE